MSFRAEQLDISKKSEKSKLFKFISFITLISQESAILVASPRMPRIDETKLVPVARRLSIDFTDLVVINRFRKKYMPESLLPNEGHGNYGKLS